MPALPKFEDWTAPWGSNDEDIDATKAAKLIYGLHKDKEGLQGRLTEATAERDTLKTKVEEFEAKDLSEIDRLKRENEKLRGEPSKVEDLTSARLEIALDKGFTKAQAARLVGTTKAELEADAEDLAKELKISKTSNNDGGDDGDDTDDSGRPPSRQVEPRRRRSGMAGSGSDDTGGLDPAALIKDIPRR